MTFSEHVINQSDNFISGWYIDKNLCKEIVSLYQARKILGKTDTTGIRNYTSISLHKLSQTIHKDYREIIYNLFDLYKEKYSVLKVCSSVQFQKDPHKSDEDVIQIQRYNPGNFYNHIHCENDGVTQNLKRCLVFMTYLNDIKQGGGTSFPSQNFTSQAEQGLTLLWPAYFTHPHVGICAPDETKFITTGWLEFIPA